MPAKTPKELFLYLLSEAKFHNEKTTKFFQEIVPFAQEQEIKQALEARIFLHDKIVATIDQVFKMMGEQPMKVTGKMFDVFVEDFTREIGEIQIPILRQLFLLANVNHVLEFRVSEFKTLSKIADITNHFGVGLLLETCFADYLTLLERNQKIMKHLVELKVLEKVVQRVAA
jgi:ferritin-like metal-binding protein YciE